MFTLGQRRRTVRSAGKEFTWARKKGNCFCLKLLSLQDSNFESPKSSLDERLALSENKRRVSSYWSGNKTPRPLKVAQGGKWCSGEFIFEVKFSKSRIRS